MVQFFVHSYYLVIVLLVLLWVYSHRVRLPQLLGLQS